MKDFACLDSIEIWPILRGQRSVHDQNQVGASQPRVYRLYFSARLVVVVVVVVNVASQHIC